MFLDQVPQWGIPTLKEAEKGTLGCESCGGPSRPFRKAHLTNLLNQQLS